MQGTMKFIYGESDLVAQKTCCIMCVNGLKCETYMFPLLGLYDQFQLVSQLKSIQLPRTSLLTEDLEGDILH